jgi:hypothetical protein
MVFIGTLLFVARWPLLNLQKIQQIFSRASVFITVPVPVYVLMISRNVRGSAHIGLGILVAAGGVWAGRSGLSMAVQGGYTWPARSTATVQFLG